MGENPDDLVPAHARDQHFVRTRQAAEPVSQHPDRPAGGYVAGEQALRLGQTAFADVRKHRFLQREFPSMYSVQ